MKNKNVIVKASLILVLVILQECRGIMVEDLPDNFAIYVKDIKGHDLLNPNIPGHFVGDEIKLYDITNFNGTVTKTLGCTDYGFPPVSNFVFKDNVGIYYLKYALHVKAIVPRDSGGYIVNFNNGSKVNSTYIQFSPTVVDTLSYGKRFSTTPNPIPDTIYYKHEPIFVFPDLANYSNHVYKITIVRSGLGE